MIYIQYICIFYSENYATQRGKLLPISRRQNLLGFRSKNKSKKSL